jgi:predicted metalloprotease with PDZ domain
MRTSLAFRTLAILRIAIALAIAAPRALAGTIALEVDAREAGRHLLHMRETIPATTGELALAFPKWIPGEHGPTGPVTDVMGLRLEARGRPLEWRRDDVDPFTIRCRVPAGADSVRLSFDYALDMDTGLYTAATCATDNLILLSWNHVVFAPFGAPIATVMVRPAVTLPAGWSCATALGAGTRAGARTAFPAVSVERLVDSPLMAGRWFRAVPLAPGPRPVTLSMACDGEAGLAMPEPTIESLRRLVREARALYGGSHFEHYDFLVPMSDHISHYGLEHHESSEDRVAERTWVEDDLRLAESTLLPHEFTHSWNGKYRRPVGLATPDYSTPMRDSLLWVYEGLTEYLAWVLAGRCGLRTLPQSEEDLARVAVRMENRRGREWRPLIDTAIEADRLYAARSAWANARRSTDFYEEGQLVWLEADVTIRKATNGRKSLDDFCRAFFGGDGPPEVKPYDQAEVVRTLNAVAPHDWDGFFHERIYGLQPHAPLGGISGGGWKLAWRDSAGEVVRAREAEDEAIDLASSIGLRLSAKEGKVTDIVPGAAADRAGVAPGMVLLGVNGRRWSREVLLDAVRATRKGGPLELLLENDERFHTCRLEYRDGLRYPALVREPSTPDLLARILAPRALAAGGVR